MSKTSISLFDDEKRINLLPLCFTRPTGDLRVGILTIAEKWKHELQASVDFITQDYLSRKFVNNGESTLFINGRLLPTKELIRAIENLKDGEGLELNGDILAFKSKTSCNNLNDVSQVLKSLTFSNWLENAQWINFPWDIFSKNAQEIKNDFIRLTEGRISDPCPAHVQIIGENPIFIEEGAVVLAHSLNTTDGPIYIGKDAEIMEGSLIRGPFALLHHGVVKMGAKIYSGTTVGPYSKVGGELNNVVIHGYSNKGHDGFLGNAVIGEWCNLGADTNNSNLKNNYGNVTIWNYEAKKEIGTGLQFAGLIMGDHSKCSINTMFNTGTVVGVSANIFGIGFPPKFIPSFTWGGIDLFKDYKPRVAESVAAKVFERRSMEFTEIESDILQEIYKQTEEFREEKK